MELFTLRENQWMPLWQAERQQSSQKQLEEFMLLAQKTAQIIKANLGLRFMPFEIKLLGANLSIRAQGIAGFFKIGHSSFQVQPKFIDTEGSESWQRSVLHILHRVRPSKLSAFKGMMGQERLSFVDHIALAYIDALNVGLLSEGVHTYSSSQQFSGVLKGRLDLGRQLSSLFSQPHLLACEVDSLDTNNDCNHLLHWALNYLKRLVLNAKIAGALIAIQHKLPPLVSSARLPQRLPPFLPNQYANWRVAVDLASSLATSIGHGQYLGRLESYGYLLNMEKVYEKLIEKSIPKIKTLLESAGYENLSFLAQPHTIYARARTAGHNHYYSIPDNMVLSHGLPLVIIDAKYKSMADFHDRKTKRPQNGDIYQLFGALIAHQCEAGLLLYPKVESENEYEDDVLKYWEIPFGNGFKLIGAVALDMGNLDTVEKIAAFDAQIFAKVRELLANIVS